MARDYEDRGNRGENTKPAYAAGRMEIEGNLTQDPRSISKGDIAVASFTVAGNYRTFREVEGTHFVSVVCTGLTAERVLSDPDMTVGTRVRVSGGLFGHTWTSPKDGVERHDMDIDADSVNISLRFPKRDAGYAGGASRSVSAGESRRSIGAGDDEEEPTARSRRRPADDDDEIEQPRRSRRPAADDDDEPPARTRRPAPAEDEEPPARSRRPAADDDDEVAPARARRRSRVDARGDDDED